jgi:hypothetical protein
MPSGSPGSKLIGKKLKQLRPRYQSLSAIRRRCMIKTLCGTRKLLQNEYKRVGYRSLSGFARIIHYRYRASLRQPCLNISWLSNQLPVNRERRPRQLKS